MVEIDAIKIYLIAGEASGDLLGAHLMRSIKTQATKPVIFYGVGGERMQAEGLKSLFPYEELSLMGFLEVLPHAYNIMARVGYTVEDILAKAPDVVVTIDVPGFCLRVVDRLRREKTKAKLVHYVAPTVWAYNAWRAEKCARLFDHMLTLLPFEPPYFEKHGLKTSFVGHPVIAETALGNAAAFRERFQIAQDTQVFCLLPGSRKSEVRRHMPVFARAAAMLAAQYPDMALAIAVPRPMLPYIEPYFAGCPFRAVITANDQDKKDALAAANLAIVKSGTVALEVAMAGAPMVVSYRVNALTAWSLRRIGTVKYVNLINILLNKEVIPELLQELCHPLAIATAGAQLLQYPTRQESQKADIAHAVSMLKNPEGQAPSDKAAGIVLGYVNPRN